ncbi:MAG: hypothetical protein IJE68_03510 [Clostridia bacterium]|nr:hypothetical protein [Clostridia bacterium]
MLAKDIKIKTLLRQRAFIEEQLSSASDSRNEDGDPAYCYTGYIYPENIEYFKNEGFDVTRVKSDMLTAARKGLPSYLFTPNNDIELGMNDMQDAEELLEKEKEEHNQRKQEIHAVAEATADRLLEHIFGVPRPYADGPDSSDEDDED